MDNKYTSNLRQIKKLEELYQKVNAVQSKQAKEIKNLKLQITDAESLLQLIDCDGVTKPCNLCEYKEKYNK